MHSLLTVAEVAEFLRKTPDAVWKMIARNQLPGVVRLGRSVRIRRNDLRAFAGLDQLPGQ